MAGDEHEENPHWVEGLPQAEGRKLLCRG